MSRPESYIPPGTTVETTTRTLCGMFLLPATRYFAKIVVGVLARAQEKHPVEIHFGAMLSNHCHLILTPEDREQLADFMEFVNGNIAREALVLIDDWDEQLWSDRYHPIPITSEPEALEGRLRYSLSHGVKEDLTEHVTDWEGFHCAQALADGVPLHGIWIDRSKLYEAQRRGKTLAREEYVEDYFLKLSPLPCWRGLPPAERHRKAREMIADEEAQAAAKRQETGRSVMGMAAVQAQSPLDRSKNLKKSRRPLVHAASMVERESYLTVRAVYVESYREASAELLRGGRNVVFPCWSFPPGLPFTRSGPIFVPFWDGCVESLIPVVDTS